MTYEETTTYAAPKKLKRQIAPKGGMITVSDLREKITKRAEDKVEMTRNVLKPAEIVVEKMEKTEIHAQKEKKNPLLKEVKVYLRPRLWLIKLLS